MKTRYAVSWRQYKYTDPFGDRSAETVVKSKTFASEEAREKFANKLQDKDSFVEFTDWLTEVEE